MNLTSLGIVANYGRGLMTALTKVASTKDIAPGESIAVEAGGGSASPFSM